MSSVAPPAVALAAPHAFASVLRERPYRRLWLSGLCVNGARWMDLVLLGWLAFQLTDSAKRSLHITAARQIALWLR